MQQDGMRLPRCTRSDICGAVSPRPVVKGREAGMRLVGVTLEMNRPARESGTFCANNVIIVAD